VKDHPFKIAKNSVALSMLRFKYAASCSCHWKTIASCRYFESGRLAPKVCDGLRSTFLAHTEATSCKAGRLKGRIDSTMKTVGPTHRAGSVAGMTQ
jgi:hypothetical protein